MKYSISFLLVLISLNLTFGQTEYPKDYFRSPVDIPIYLSATFGELRGGHFHAGIDIKTRGVQGKKIYAIADGYVSRIKVSLNGYGNALYIAHPNGFTSVYGHLKEFVIHIDELLKDHQYKNQQFVADIFPEKNQITVKKGEIIGLSGNSGGSLGPHLHFEIRETRTQEPINPLLCGFAIIDNISPRFHAVYLYPLDNFSSVNGKQDTLRLKVSGEKGNYQLNTDQSLKLSGNIGFGIHANDYHNYTRNKCGIYFLEMKVDGQTYYSHSIDQFSFAHTRFINSHMDYALYLKNKIKLHRCFHDPYNMLDIYNELKNRGVVSFLDDNKHHIEFSLIDENNNTSLLSFAVQSVPPDTSAITVHKADSGDITMPFDTENEFIEKNIEIYFPPYAFYDTVRFSYKQTLSDNEEFPLYHIHHKYTPVHKNYDLKIYFNDTVKITNPDKTFIAMKNGDELYSPLETNYEKGYYTASPRDFGTFTFLVDTIAPQIKALKTEKDILEINDRIGFKALDELTGIDHFNGYINGEWVLFECDRKNDFFWHTLDGRIQADTLELEFVVTDMAGNESVYKNSYQFNSESIY